MNEQSELSNTTYSPGSSLRTRLGGGPQEGEAIHLVKIPSHLVEGYRILQFIMTASNCFQQNPDPRVTGMYDYYEVIKQPMCFDKIKWKFINKEYTQLSEFVYDVRLLLLNCYQFFGRKGNQTKQALHVEEVLEKRLALLSEEQRELCSLQATHGRLYNVEENAAALIGSHFESKLLESVENEKYFRIIDRKQKLQLELERPIEDKEKELLLWERQTLFTQSDHEMMKHMWEIPVIGLYTSISIYELEMQTTSIYEVERMFLMPQASKSLGRLMTTLLNTPLTRLKIHIKPSMPYKLWSKILSLKVSGWYKIYVKSNNDPQIVFKKLGIVHQFWKILGDLNPLEKREFHELTFHQRVFLVKTLCDYILHDHEFIRDIKNPIAKMTEEFGTCLGTDRTGAKYIYFPQFLSLDVRIYKQTLDSGTSVDRNVDHEAEMCKVKTESGMESCTKEEQKERHTLHCATQLEPDPQDFVLIADSVAGVKELLHKFCVDDVELIQRLSNSKKNTNNRPICEVKLALHLVALIKDLETVELKLIMERKKVRAKLYEEWRDFINRPADFVDPVEAFWLNEKEPIETHDGEVPGTSTEMQPDVPSLEGSDLPQRQDAESLQIPDRDSLDALAGGMIFKHRCIENSPSQELKEFFLSDTKEQSSEHKGDYWEIPKNRKRKRTKQLKCTLCNEPSKQKESVQKQNEACKVSAEITETEDPDIQIMDYIKIYPAKKLVTADTLQVKKHQFFQSEANRQLEWENKRQKLVNMVSDESTKDLKTTSPKTKIIMDNSNKILLDNTGILSVPSTNSNQALTNLQGRKLDDVIRQGKVVKGKAVITGVIGVEMENSKSPAQTSESLQPLSAGGPSIEQTNVLNISDNSKSCVNVGVVQALHNANTNDITSTESVNISQPSTNIADSYSLNEETVSTATKPPQNMTQIEEVVILSDESDNDIEFIGVVYNPKLDRNLATKHKPHEKSLSQEDGSMGQPHSSRRESSVNPELSVRQGQGNSSRASGEQNLINVTSPQYYKNIYAVNHSSPIQCNNQKQTSTSMISTPEIRIGNSQRNNVFTPQKSCISASSPTLVYQTDRVTEVSPRYSACQPGHSVIRRNIIISPGSAMLEPRTAGSSTIIRGNMIISPGSGVPQPRTAGSSTVVRGNTIISPGSGVPQPRTAGSSTVVRGNTIISPGSGVPQPRTAGSSTVVRGNMIISPGSGVPQPRTAGSSTVVRGNTMISPGSGVPQPRTAGSSTVVRGNTIISPGSGVPQPKTAGSSTVVRENTIISPVYGVPQPSTAGSSTVVRRNTIIFPVSGVPQPRTAGSSTVVRGNTIIFPVSGVPQPRTAGSSTVVRGNTIISPGTGVPQPRTAGSSTIIRGNTIISPGSGIPQQRTAGSSTVVRGNTIISPGSGVPQPRTAESSTVVRGNTIISQDLVYFNQELQDTVL